MIEMAKGFNRHPDKVEYVHNPGADLRLFDDGVFDLVFSLITLQHMNRRHACRYLEEFVRVTKPGGYIVFQIPSRRLPERSFRLRWRRRLMRGIEWVNRSLLIDRRPYFEMHTVSESTVRQVLTRAGAIVIEATPNSGAGERYLSIGYLARKVRKNYDL
jgi:ubiquinone/menaquinone biosynthesis C-methylase UbiE